MLGGFAASSSVTGGVAAILILTQKRLVTAGCIVVSLYLASSRGVPYDDIKLFIAWNQGAFPHDLPRRRVVDDVRLCMCRMWLDQLKQP